LSTYGPGVVKSEPEHRQLKAETRQPEKNDSPCASAGDSTGAGSNALIVEVVETFTVSELAKLTGLSRQRILAVIGGKELDNPLGAWKEPVKKDGHRKNCIDWHIPYEPAFQYFPQAKKAWDIEQSVKATAERMRAEEERKERERAEGRRSAGLYGGKRSGTDVEAARVWHVQRFRTFEEGLDPDTPKVERRVLYIEALKRGDGSVPEPPDWVKRLVGAFGEHTLQRMCDKFDKEGAAGLARKYRGNPTSHWTRHPEWERWMEGMVAAVPHILGEALWNQLRAEFKGADRLPGKGAVYRWLHNFKTRRAQEYLMLANPDAAKSKYQVAFGNASGDVVRYLQRVELDNSKVDLKFTDDPHRYTVNGVLEVFSGSAMLSLSRTATARAQCELFLRFVREVGSPEEATTDNGADYVSVQFTGFMAAIGAMHRLCAPFSGEQKPHVENMLGRFNRALETMPGFLGHNVAGAQAIRAQKTFAQRLKEGGEFETGVTKAEFIEFMEKWVAADYAKVRESGRHKGRSSKQIVDEWAASNPVRRLENADMLEFLLSEPVERVVDKKGIRFNGRIFIAGELGGIVGSPVVIRESLVTAGRVAVFHRGDFLCLAECPALVDVDVEEVAAKAHAVQKAVQKAQRAVHRELKKQVNPKAVMEAVLDERIAAGGNVSQLQVPERVSTATTAAAVAAKAAEALEIEARKEAEGAPETQVLPYSEERLAEIRASMGRRREQDPIERCADLLRKDPETLSFEERDWLHWYCTEEPAGIAMKARIDKNRRPA